jgi:hypothetical protein
LTVIGPPPLTVIAGGAEVIAGDAVVLGFEDEVRTT